MNQQAFQAHGHAQKPQGPFPHSPPGLGSLNPSTNRVAPSFDTQPSLVSQAAYDYNSTAIPGLSFAAPGTTPTASNTLATPKHGNQDFWKAQPSTTSHTTFRAISGNYTDANKSPQPQYTSTTMSVVPPHTIATVAAPENHRDSTIIANDAMEEGELDESAFEDIYEPYIEPIEHTNVLPVPTSQNTLTDDEDYDPAQPGSPIAHLPVTKTGPGDSAIAGRERSRSYSPYLSPGELSVTSPPPQQASADGLDEGIDPNIIRDLFAGLGLDTKATKPLHEPQSRLKNHPANASTTEKSAPPPEATPQPSSAAVPAAAPPNPPPTTTSQKQEERKDRIARLLAAKNAKQQGRPTKTIDQDHLASASRNTMTSSLPAQPGPHQNLQQANPAANAGKASKNPEKERLLQRKLEALQKSRALKAQKAALDESDSHRTEPETNTPNRNADVPEHPSTSLLKDPQTLATGHDIHIHSQNRPSATQTSGSIPGLFLSESTTTNTRKRPTASDLNENSAVPPFKRTFSQHHVEKPLVIDVSDESEDEDVEMEISSQVDDAPTEPNNASYPQKGKPPAHRDQPPLPDVRNQRSFASPASVSGSMKQTDSAELQRINQDIDEMKRKIAEAERRKRAKLTSKDITSSQSPATGPGTPCVSQPLISGPSSAQSQSPDSQSPRQTYFPHNVVGEVQKTLPKAPRGAAATDAQRRQRIRVVSDSLPTLESTIRSKVTKLRLLKSEVSRIEKEVDEMLAEKAKLSSEFETLTKDGEEGTTVPTVAEHGSSSTSDQPTPQYPSHIVATDPESSRTELEQIASIPEEASSIPDAPAPTGPTGATPNGGIETSHGAGEDGSTDQVTSGVQQAPTKALEDVPMTDLATLVDTESIGLPPLQTDSTADLDDMAVVSMAVDDEPHNALDHTPRGINPHASPSSEPASRAHTDTQEAEFSLVPTHISNGAANTSEESPEPSNDDAIAPVRAATPGFAPYKSVLREFLSYRFHPNFSQEVSQGLRSLTYSNKINPKEPFCLDSLLPEGCPRGTSCEFQHPDSVDIPDSQILLQLGNSERLEGKEQERYIDGLRALLSEFKAKQSKDFNLISKAIVDYRAQFYADQSRVLPLGNINL
ncbi:hypothetical protein jhhlp_004028 [Lomentospora prolificans]|uniref:C3H1-type domain-containing protein n=1 Tax=Lomentospora prolificans TaxID=41688 RepID=A0A2N3NAF0_9PEZI|nr:hypothetical protein jhhlp_004028 [Lomentospora prolificans]